jgi:hypothetical protein
MYYLAPKSKEQRLVHEENKSDFDKEVNHNLKVGFFIKEIKIHSVVVGLNIHYTYMAVMERVEY